QRQLTHDCFPYTTLFRSNDLMGVAFLEAGLRVSQTVARIWVQVANGRPAAYGTGFLVGPNLLMTNHHVLSDASDARASLAEFNYQVDADGLEIPTIKFRFDVDRFFYTDTDLDYTVVAVAEMNDDGRPLGEFGWNRLIVDQGK